MKPEEPSEERVSKRNDSAEGVNHAMLIRKWMGTGQGLPRMHPLYKQTVHKLHPNAMAKGRGWSFFGKMNFVPHSKEAESGRTLQELGLNKQRSCFFLWSKICGFFYFVEFLLLK